MGRSNRGVATVPFLAAVCLGLAACGEDGTGRTDATSGLVLPVPEAILQSRAIELGNLEVDVAIDGTPVEAERVGDTWRVSTLVPEGVRIRPELTWYERVGEARLRLVTFSEPIGPIERDTAFALEQSDYVSDPYDADQDGVPNLDERVAGTNPYDEDDPGESPPLEADVVVPMLAPEAGTPNTDGFIGEAWERAVGTDANGETLAIDNLVRGGERAEAADGEAPYAWRVTHNGEFLFLLVEFEPEGSATVFGDSDRFFNDDAVNLFFDGDLSRGERIEGTDGGDDRYFFIRQAIRDGEDVAEARAPFSSAPELPPSLRYGVSARGWEIRVALADLNVRVGEPFGFEVQIDQDLDGDERDARWAWAYPRRDGDPDPFERSSLNGTVLLTE